MMSGRSSLIATKESAWIFESSFTRIRAKELASTNGFVVSAKTDVVLAIF